MSHYCCKNCGQRYDACSCSPGQNPAAPKPKEKTDFTEIAKDSAWMNRYNHSYIPDNKNDFQRWKPHKWVIDAIELAYQAGLRDKGNK